MTNKLVKINKQQILNEELNLGGSNLLYRTERFDSIENLQPEENKFLLYISNENDLIKVGKLANLDPKDAEAWYDSHAPLRDRKTPGHKQEFIKWAHKMSKGSISFATSKMSTFITNRDNEYTTLIYTFDMDALRKFGTYAGYYWDRIVGGHYGDELELRLLPREKYFEDGKLVLSPIEKYIKKIDIWMSANKEIATEDMQSNNMKKLINFATSKNIPMFIYDFKWMCLKNFGQYIIKQKMPQDIIDKSNIFFVRRNGEVFAANNKKEYTFGGMRDPDEVNTQELKRWRTIFNYTEGSFEKIKSIDFANMFDTEGRIKEDMFVLQMAKNIMGLNRPLYQLLDKPQTHQYSINDPLMFDAITNDYEVVLLNACSDIESWSRQLINELFTFEKHFAHAISNLQIKLSEIVPDSGRPQDEIIKNVFNTFIETLQKLSSFHAAIIESGEISYQAAQAYVYNIIFGEIFHESVNLVEAIERKEENPIEAMREFILKDCVESICIQVPKFLKGLQENTTDPSSPDLLFDSNGDLMNIEDYTVEEVSGNNALWLLKKIMGIYEDSQIKSCYDAIKTMMKLPNIKTLFEFMQHSALVNMIQDIGFISICIAEADKQTKNNRFAFVFYEYYAELINNFFDPLSKKIIQNFNEKNYNQISDSLPQELASINEFVITNNLIDPNNNTLEEDLQQIINMIKRIQAPIEAHTLYPVNMVLNDHDLDFMKVFNKFTRSNVYFEMVKRFLYMKIAQREERTFITVTTNRYNEVLESFPNSISKILQLPETDKQILLIQLKNVISASIEGQLRRGEFVKDAALIRAYSTLLHLFSYYNSRGFNPVMPNQNSYDRTKFSLKELAQEKQDPCYVDFLNVFDKLTTLYIALYETVIAPKDNLPPATTDQPTQ